MQRSGAAVGEEREVARVVAAHDRDLLDARRHLGDDEGDDPLRHRLRLDADAAAEPLDGRFCEPRIELDLAAEQTLGAEPAEDDIGVRHRGLASAAAVAGGPGCRTRRLRADRDHPPGVEPGDRAGTRADAVDLDLLQLEREGADAPLGRHGEGAVAHEAGIRRGPAHVVGDEVAVARGAADEMRADDAGGRAREHRADRPLDHARDRPGAAVRGHDVDRPGVAARAEPALQCPQIASHARADIGVERRRGEPLVLAVLGEHLRGERDHGLRQCRAHDLGGRALVRVVRVGVEVADGDRLHAAPLELGGNRGHFLALDRAAHGAVVERALRDLEDRTARHQRRRPRRLDVVEDGAVAAADLEHVAEAARGDDRRARALALEDRVGRDRGAVGELGHAPELDAHARDPGENRHGRVLGRGRHLVDRE